MDFTNEKCVMLIDDSLPLGLIEFPIPILKAPPERIKAIREALYEDEFAYLTVVDFSNLAQGCKTYSEFIEKVAQKLSYTLERKFGKPFLIIWMSGKT